MENLAESDKARNKQNLIIGWWLETLIQKVFWDPGAKLNENSKFVINFKPR